ncbi:MAG: hypothetical protein ACI9DO_002537, partial [Reinekea sp.]
PLAFFSETPPLSILLKSSLNKEFCYHFDQGDLLFNCTRWSPQPRPPAI